MFFGCSSLKTSVLACPVYSSAVCILLTGFLFKIQAPWPSVVLHLLAMSEMWILNVFEMFYATPVVCVWSTLGSVCCFA